MGEIQTKFIELTPDTDLPAPQKLSVYSDPQFQVVVRALNQKKGVDILSASRVTAKSGQRAIVKIVRDFRYPSEWEKDGQDAWVLKFEAPSILQ